MSTATLMMAVSSSPPLKPESVHLPSMATGAAHSPFLHPSVNGPASAPIPGRRSSITDPEMHAHAAEGGSRPGSAQQDFGGAERRDSTVEDMVFQGQKRKTSDPDYVPEGEVSGGSSSDLNAKRRSSAFSVTANRLDSLSLNHRRSSTSSAYSTGSSGAAGWSPAPGNPAYAWQGHTAPAYAFGSAPTFMAPPSSFPGDAAAQAPRAGAPLAEQLANYGFPPHTASSLSQTTSAIGPITARRGSVPMLGTRSSIGSVGSSGGGPSDPRRVFGKEEDDDLLDETGRSRAASADDTNNPNMTSSPYSRSPELRVSHKLAERKRRKEMSGLFDELRDAVPTERGSRSSKWETLVKAIDFINHLKEANEELQRDNELMRAHIGIPGRNSGALPYLAPLPAGQPLAAGAIPMPQPHAPVAPAPGDQFAYNAPYLAHAMPAGWPPATGGGGQQTPRPGAPYMNAPPGTQGTATASTT